MRAENRARFPHPALAPDKGALQGQRQSFKTKSSASRTAAPRALRRAASAGHFSMAAAASATATAPTARAAPSDGGLPGCRPLRHVPPSRPSPGVPDAQRASEPRSRAPCPHRLSVEMRKVDGIPAGGSGTCGDVRCLEGYFECRHGLASYNRFRVNNRTVFKQDYRCAALPLT